MVVRSYFTLFFTLILSVSSFSQNDAIIEKYIHSFQDYNKYFQEHFYTQFNKSNYFPGENIWFQIYITDKQKEKLSDNTKKVYADLYDSGGKLIERKILRSAEGIAYNYLKIPDDYKAKAIYLKVSTDWSKNYDREYIDEISVNIHSADIRISDEITDSIPKIYFFPESGHFIEGVPARVGVKVVDRFNNGFFFSGEIEDEEGHLIVIFKTNQLGMGSFIFHPEKDKRYRLRKFIGTKKDHIYLPDPEKDGVLLNVLEKGNEYRFFFRTNKYGSNKKLYHYIIYNNYKIAVAGSFNFNGGITSLQTFKKNELLKGLNTITLFDHNFKPVAERVFFNSEGISFNNNIIATTSRRNSNDTADIVVYNKGIDSVYHMAVSILPEESISRFPVKSFLSDYYLSSEVKGSIEDPNYYFKDNKHIKELDYLLLTQGWRKFNWEDLRSGKLNKLSDNKIRYPLENGIMIKGKVVNKRNGIPLKNEQISLFYHNKTLVTLSDSLGDFSFINVDLIKNDTVRLYANPDKRIKKSISIDDSVNDSVITLPPYKRRKIKPRGTKLIATENFESIVNIYDEGERLNEVELFVKVKNEFDDKDEKIDTYVNPMENTSFTKSFYVNKDNVGKYRTVLNYLESLPGLKVISNGSQIAIYSSRTMEQDIIHGAKRPIDIYIDNNKLSHLDIETLGMLDMGMVRNINVNKSGIGFGGENPYGRINIYLNYGAAFHKNMKEKENEISDNILNFIIKNGFARNKEYYTPEYKFSPKENYYRKTASIHWQPGLNVTKKGAQFKIKIPKTIKNCIILIEGISEKGNIISIKKEMKIDMPN